VKQENTTSCSVTPTGKRAMITSLISGCINGYLSAVKLVQTR
jgi:hypothetical protein